MIEPIFITDCVVKWTWERLIEKTRVYYAVSTKSQKPSRSSSIQERQVDETQDTCNDSEGPETSCCPEI